MATHSVRRKTLLVSTMLAGAFFAYSNRAHGQQVCTHQTSGATYLCNGVTSQQQTFFGENIIVVTGDNFVVDTTAPGSLPGNAFNLGEPGFGVNGTASFIDVDGATLIAGPGYTALSVIGGGDYNYYGTLYIGNITVYTNGTLLGGRTGLYAFNNSGSGSVDITVNGSVTGTDYYGIHARNSSAGDELIITTGAGSSVSGGYSGILAENNGQGVLAITANGDVTGANYIGIAAQNHGTDLTVTTGAGTTVTGGEVGIAAINSGSGQLTVAAGGDVTGAVYYGILVQNQGTGLAVTTEAGTSVAGGFSGIEARNFGSGTLDITADGDVAGQNGYGIRARNNSSGSDLTITTGAESSVSGGYSGILAENNGQGVLAITANGDVSGAGYIGISAQNHGTDLIVTTGTGTLVTGDETGIAAINSGSGQLTVTAGGDVTGAVYYGILAQNQGSDLAVTTEAGSSVVGGFSGIEARNFGSGMLTVSVDGDVAGLNGHGIRVQGSGTGLVVTTGADSTVSGDTTGIYASNTGSGAVTINAQGDVKAFAIGIYAANSNGVDADGNSINITTGGTIEGTGLGIYAVNHGAGAVNIISTGDVLNSSSGIFAYNTSSSSTAINIEAARVTTQLSSIYALNNGTGDLTILATGDITSMNGTGITAFQAGGDVEIVTLAGTTVSGGSRAISAVSIGTGALTITAGGDVHGIGNNSRGIFAWNSSATGTGLSISTQAVSGGINGVYALNDGTGALTIVADGDVQGFAPSGTGIDARNNSATSTDLSITTQAVSGTINGIFTRNNGTGVLTVTAGGDVTANVSHGIYARNEANGTGLEITSQGVSGGQTGIEARNDGSGALTITAAGIVTGSSSRGLRAHNEGTDLTITTGMDVTGGNDGIEARNFGSGAMTITANGNVTGTNRYGIFAGNSGDGLSVTTGPGAHVTGGQSGLLAYNYNAGALSVTVNGDVTGHADKGVYAINTSSNTTALTITTAAGTTVSGVSGGIGALSNGSGAVTVNAQGNVHATDAYSAGILVFNSNGIDDDGNSVNIIVAGAVSGGSDGIYAYNYGPGALNIVSTGDVSGGTGSGIFARNFGDGILISAETGASITGNTHGINAQNSGAGIIEIDIAAGSAVTSTGSGYAINLSGSDSVVSVAGTLNGGADGAIRFGDFDNLLIMHTGAQIHGDVVGGAQDDTLSLTGAGIGTFDIGQLRSFEALTQDGGGHWILTGTNADAMSFALNEGRLTIDAALGFTDITVNGGAILGGTGAIGGDVTVLDGGVIAPGASTGTLTVGNLFLSSGSVLDFELGMAGVVGGGVNDLIVVGNDLVLDGVLNVTDVGGFGPGVYTLIKYGGELTDNGLLFGALPAGITEGDLFIQTAVAGEINLLSSAGLTLGFWDGADTGLHDNSVIDGGNGIWSADTRHWTAMDGELNGLWDGGFAVFQGAAGTVTVEGGLDFAGLQIRTDGYLIESGTDGVLTMSEAETIIRVEAGVTGEVSAAIAGAGALIKTDYGTLILSGENTYTGGTILRNGVVEVSSDSNLGAASGGLTFEGGVLRLGDDFTSARTLLLDGDGHIDTNGFQGVLSGAITGPGDLHKAGEGVLRLTGANDYGDTFVHGGTLIGHAGNLSGDIMVASAAQLVFDQSADASFAGAVSGDGLAVKDGGGELTLTGSSPLDWRIDAGGLIATTDVFSGNALIGADAYFAFDQDVDGVFAGAFTGEGAFHKNGTGTVTLTGNHSLGAGSFVNAGGLLVTGLLDSDVTVGADGLLGGTGTIGGDVTVAGTLSPGMSIGTLSASGDVTFLSGSTFLVEVDAAGNSDLLAVDGAIAIEGGVLLALSEDTIDAFNLFTETSIMTAGGGITGMFDDVISSLPFLNGVLNLDGGTLTLTLAPSGLDFADVAQTRNQRAVAGTLDAIWDPSMPAGDMRAVIEAVFRTTGEQALTAFDSLSGESHGSLQAAAGRMALSQQRVHTGQRLGERREEAVDAMRTGGEPAGARLGASFWLAGNGLWSDVGADGNAGSFDARGSGVMAGVDTGLASGVVAGLAGQLFTSRDISFDNGDSANMTSWGAQLYAGFMLARGFDAEFGAGWLQHEVDARRTVTVNSFEWTARSSYVLRQYAFNAVLGHSFDWQDATIRPRLGVNYAHVRRDGFTETGADSAGLTVEAASFDTVEGLAGADISTRIDLGQGYTFIPSLGVSYVRHLSGEDAAITASFAGAPDTPFEVHGMASGRDRLETRLSLRLDLGDGISADLGYQAALRTRETTHAGMLAIRMGW